MSDFQFYLEQYWFEILLAMPYFASVSIFGVFLLLRRSSLYGAVLSQTAQISFLIGTALHFQGHDGALDLINRSNMEDISSELFHLDLYVMPITLLILLPFIWISRKPMLNSESSLLIIFVFLTGTLPLFNKLMGGGDGTLLKIYFTEILYTPSEVFLFYLIHVISMTFILLLIHRVILLSGYDPVQSMLNGWNPGFHNIVFFLLTAVLLSATIRVLGIYVTLGAMFAPGMAALRLGRTIRGTLVWAASLSVILATAGFMVAFIYDSLPTEPLVLIVMITGCLLIRTVSFAPKKKFI